MPSSGKHGNFKLQTHFKCNFKCNSKCVISREIPYLSDKHHASEKGHTESTRVVSNSNKNDINTVQFRSVHCLFAVNL